MINFIYTNSTFRNIDSPVTVTSIWYFNILLWYSRFRFKTEFVDPSLTCKSQKKKSIESVPRHDSAPFCLTSLCIYNFYTFFSGVSNYIIAWHVITKTNAPRKHFYRMVDDDDMLHAHHWSNIRHQFQILKVSYIRMYICITGFISLI